MRASAAIHAHTHTVLVVIAMRLSSGRFPLNCKELSLNTWTLNTHTHSWRCVRLGVCMRVTGVGACTLSVFISQKQPDVSKQSLQWPVAASPHRILGVRHTRLTQTHTHGNFRLLQGHTYAAVLQNGKKDMARSRSRFYEDKHLCKCKQHIKNTRRMYYMYKSRTFKGMTGIRNVRKTWLNYNEM